jgi:serine/threonine protein kinase
MERERSAKVPVMITDDTMKSPTVSMGANPSEEQPEQQRRIGDYRLVAEVARGGMGIVYLALRRTEIVWLKELRHEFLDNAGVVRMFEEESRLALLLSHPNIVQTVDVGTDGKRRFIAMEYLEGQPLSQLVRRAVAQSKHMPLRVHLRILLEILSALDSAHRATERESGLGIVHGEVSPHKVLLTYEGQVKLIDFGPSETFGAMAETPTSRAVDKVRYMAPEHAAGEHLDGRTDLFAVGAMLWEAIFDRRPWDDQPDDAVWRSLRAGSVPRMRDAWPYVDPNLAAIVDRSMSARPDQRYPTAAEMRRDLECYIATLHIRLPSAESLGDFVSGLFEKERETRRAQVQSLLRSHTAADAPVAGRPVPLAVKSEPTPSLPNRSTPDAAEVAPEIDSALPPRHASGRRTMLPAAIAAGLASFVALAVVSAARLHAGDVRPPVPTPPAIFVATVVRPPIPTVSIDEVPGASNSAVSVSPSPAVPRLGRKPAAPGTHAVVSPPPTISASISASTSDCEPPFSIDPETGKKQWRMDCL